MMIRYLLSSYQHIECHQVKHFGEVLGKKAKGFVKKAGTFIFAGSVVIWLLNYTGPGGFNVDVDDSFLHSIGSFFAILVAPSGFGTWQAGATLIPGFLAKEVIVSSMAIIYASDESGLVNIIQHQFTPLSAYAFMIFILLYIPCLSTDYCLRFDTGILSNRSSIYVRK